MKSRATATATIVTACLATSAITLFAQGQFNITGRVTPPPTKLDFNFKDEAAIGSTPAPTATPIPGGPDVNRDAAVATPAPISSGPTPKTVPSTAGDDTGKLESGNTATANGTNNTGAQVPAMVAVDDGGVAKERARKEKPHLKGPAHDGTAPSARGKVEPPTSHQASPPKQARNPWFRSRTQSLSGETREAKKEKKQPKAERKKKKERPEEADD